MIAPPNLLQSPRIKEAKMPDCDPGPKGPDDLLTLAGISKEFGVSRQTPHDWVDSGLEPDECAISGGKNVPLFRRSTVEAFYSDPDRTRRRDWVKKGRKDMQ